ncbi:MAG: hypothetical protein WBX20_08790 [Terrimicrobiaceae bacterium]
MPIRRFKLLRTVGLPLTCLAFFSLAGGHWFVLQTIAWVQMVREYSRSAPILEAVEKTFSGDYPCTMCTRIAEGQQNEEKSPSTVKLAKKTEVFLLAERDLPGKPAIRDFSYPAPREISAVERSEAPPVPVPIVA